MAHTLDALRLLIGGVLLLYASVRDWRDRRVENHVWVVGAALGGILFAVDYVGHRATGLHVAVALLIIAAAYVLWYLHLLAGGADSKALMMLAILLPVPLHWDALGHQFPFWESPLPTALVVFANSVLAFLIAPFLMLVVNLTRGHVKFPAMFFGYKMPLEWAARSFVWIVERPRPDGTLRQMVWASRQTEEEYRANVARLRELGVREVWTTPKIPFMIPLLSGFFLAFFLGDLLTHFIVARFVPGLG